MLFKINNSMHCRPLFTESDIDIPELSEAVIRKILTKCVAVIVVHAGFESKFATFVLKLIFQFKIF